MKNLKTYEGFLDKFYEKLPDVKVAIAFVNFLNSINPELKCFYKRNNDGVWIKTADKILIVCRSKFNRTEVVLSYRFGSGWGDDFNKYPRTGKKQEKWTGEIVNFLNTFDDINPKCINCTFDDTKISDDDTEGGGVSFAIYESKIQEFVNKLTKENYEQFLLETNANKYNL